MVSTPGTIVPSNNSYIYGTYTTGPVPPQTVPAYTSVLSFTGVVIGTGATATNVPNNTFSLCNYANITVLCKLVLNSKHCISFSDKSGFFSLHHKMFH